MFNSAKPLKAATLSLALPENVELVGYGNRREAFLADGFA